MTNRFLRTAAGVLAAVLLFTMPASAISAKRAIVLDASTGRVLYEKDADSRSLIASTTKIMTALIVCEQCNVLDRVKIPKEAVGIEGSSMYLKEGEVLTVQELLYGLMLSSGNDAAVALAIFCGGTVEGFAEMMNDKARLLGMHGSHFTNPNGLDHPDHYATARDLAVLGAYAMENPVFAKTVSARSVHVAGRTLVNHNKLLWRLEGADGIKTGYTRAAGRILVSSAIRQGRRLVAVTIHAPDDWKDHEILLERGFSEFRPHHIVAAGDVLGRAEVPGGTQSTVEILASEDFFFPLTEQEKPEIRLPGTGMVYAPVAQGQDAGTAYICLNGNPVGKIAVEYGQTVEQNVEQTPGFWERLSGFFRKGRKDI